MAGNVFFNGAVPGSGNLVIPVAGNFGDINDLTLRFTYTGMNDNNSLVYGGAQTILDAAPVPEPTTLMMFGSVVGLGLVNRRRRR